MNDKSERDVVTQVYARGVVIGALVLTFFGEFWASESISNLPKTPFFAYGILTLPMLALTLFAVIRLVNIVKLPPSTADDWVIQNGERTGMTFGIIFAVEFIAIAVAAVILNKLNRPMLVPVAIALIVPGAGDALFRPAAMFIGLVWLTSGGATLYSYLRHTQPPAPEAE